MGDETLISVFKDESISITYDSYFDFMVVDFKKAPDEFAEGVKILLERIRNYTFRKSKVGRFSDATNVTLGENYVMINMGMDFFSSDLKYYLSEEETSGDEILNMLLDNINNLT